MAYGNSPPYIKNHYHAKYREIYKNVVSHFEVRHPLNKADRESLTEEI